MTAKLTRRDAYAAYLARAAAASVEPRSDKSFPSIAKIVEATSAIKLPTKGRKSDDQFVSLADIARDLNINPKVARAKARRLDAKGELNDFDRKAGERHVFARHEVDRLHILFSEA